jgi:hypothetical protein
MLFPKAILHAEFGANAPLLEALAINRERLPRPSSTLPQQRFAAVQQVVGY